jgi:hypothetical protein
MSKTTSNLLFNFKYLLDPNAWERLTELHRSDAMENKIVQFSKKNVIAVFSDHLGDDVHYLLPDSQRPLSKLESLINIIRSNPNQKFWIFCGALNLNKIECTLSNVKFIHWIDEMFVITDCFYHEISPQKEKNFNSDKHWISLSQNKRIHRYLAAMYLLGENLESTGLIKFDDSEFYDHETWELYQNYWEYNGKKDEFDKLLTYPSFEKGFNKIKNQQGFQSNTYRNINDPETPNLAAEKYHLNFDKFLKPLYKNSFVEIVNDTVFMQDYGIITEKYLNTVYGFNLPIILNSPNAVAHLRDIGFDMFDSVIDHSYDTILDPIPRLIHALSSNKHLLENTKLAKLAWQQCLPGMENNYQLAYNLETTLESTFKEHLLRIRNEC